MSCIWFLVSQVWDFCSRKRLPSRFVRRCLCRYATTEAHQGTQNEIKLASFFSHLRALILFVRLPTCTKNTLSLRSPIRSNNSLSAYQTYQQTTEFSTVFFAWDRLGRDTNFWWLFLTFSESTVEFWGKPNLLWNKNIISLDRINIIHNRFSVGK